MRKCLNSARCQHIRKYKELHKANLGVVVIDTILFVVRTLLFLNNLADATIGVEIRMGKLLEVRDEFSIKSPEHVLRWVIVVDTRRRTICLCNYYLFVCFLSNNNCDVYHLLTMTVDILYLML